MVRRAALGATLSIEPAAGGAAFLWAVQSRWPGGWQTEIVSGHTRVWRVGSATGMSGVPELVWVSAVDRLGNQGAPVRALVRAPTH